VLDGLEKRIDISNQNLKAAEAAFQEAEWDRRTGSGRLFSDRYGRRQCATLARRRGFWHYPGRRWRGRRRDNQFL
jgi:hypothetical protein